MTSSDANFYEVVRSALARAGAGRDLESLQSGVFFQTDLSAGFQGSEITEISVSEGRRSTLRTRNFSLAGNLGALPSTISEWARDGDNSINEFLDIFNNRANALRYVVKATGRPSLREADYRHNAESNTIAALLGFRDVEEGRHELGSAFERLVEFFALIREIPCNARQLQRALSIVTGADVRITELNGDWLDIPRAELTRVGRADCMLGRNTFAGTQYRDQAARVGIRIGPLPYTEFLDLLPRGHSFGFFRRLFLVLTNFALDADVRLLLEPDAPAAVLDSAADGMRLSRTAWLHGDSERYADFELRRQGRSANV